MALDKKYPPYLMCKERNGFLLSEGGMECYFSFKAKIVKIVLWAGYEIKEVVEDSPSSFHRIKRMRWY